MKDNQQIRGIDRGELIAYVDQFLDEVLDRLRKADEPVWKHQAQLGRTLITLAGGGIIASVSVIQLLADKISHPIWPWLLSVCWISWTLCILTGLSREAWTSRARGAAAIFERRRGELRSKITKLGAESTVDDVEQVVINALNEADKEPQKAVKVHDVLGQIAYWTFALGIASLVAFAVKNLPF